jgi:hypothetical protein
VKLASIFRVAPITVLLLAASWKAAAQVEPKSTESPRWSYEIRGGYIDPDLDLFETFYGDDRESYYGLTGSYRIRSWLEVGGEYSQMRAKGVGILTTSQMLGGSVDYRLSPAQIYTNFIFQRSSLQRVVPYVGLGLTVAKYDQDVELQGSNEGITDLGLSVRVGVRFLLMTRGSTTFSAAVGNAKWSSFLFLEAQHISAEVDDIDLGGEAYTLGFRMEFDLE